MNGVSYKYGKGESIMKVTEVNRLNRVDVTLYQPGDVFLTKQSIGILHNGKIETLVKQSDVRKMVRDELKKVTKND